MDSCYKGHHTVSKLASPIARYHKGRFGALPVLHTNRKHESARLVEGAAEMPIADCHKMLLDAHEGGYAVGAFNATNLQDISAMIEAAEARSAPLIIQTTERVVRFFGPRVITAVFKVLAQEASIPVGLHLDHCTDVSLARECADSGYSSVMFDGSGEPFETNVRKTTEVVDYCHRRAGVYAEGELGAIGGREDDITRTAAEAQLCQPRQVLDFVQQTGVDWLAPAIGNTHGFYKTQNPVLDFERLGKIQALITASGMRTPLVIHGGTGIPAPSVRKLVACGVVKFNVGTDLKKAKIDAAAAYVCDHRGEYLPEQINPQLKKAVKGMTESWLDRLDASGRASSMGPDCLKGIRSGEVR